MILTDENYYSKEADEEYMSVSQFKSIAGTFGRPTCEFKGLMELRRKYEEEPSTAMMIGSYVDAYFEGELDKFKQNTPEIFTQKGELRADYKHANKIIDRIESDIYMKAALSGEKQKIMTGELFGCKWKIKMDSYLKGEAIVDLKVVKAIRGKEAYTWVKDYGYTYFALVWGYDIQGAIYQEIVRQNTGEKLPFYLACGSKEKPEPDIDLMEIKQEDLDFALRTVKQGIDRVLAIKSGKEKPVACGVCDCCRKYKVITGPAPLPHYIDDETPGGKTNWIIPESIIS